MAQQVKEKALGAGGAAPQGCRQAAGRKPGKAETGSGGAAEQNKKKARSVRSIQQKKTGGKKASIGKWEAYDYESAYELPLDQLTEQQLQEMIDKERKVIYATKTVKHGHQCDVEIYPDFTHLPGNLPKDRSNREAQRNLNDRNSRKECERRINENFGPHDYWVTLTYLAREEPQTMEEALRVFQNYIKRLNYRRKKKGLDPARYVYVTDWTKNGRRTRTHHHLVLDGGLTMREVLELWAKGRKNTVEYLVLDERGLSGLSYYITKPHASDTEDIKHKKRWTASKNLRRPAEHKNHQAFGRRKVEAMAKAPADIYGTMERKYPRYWCEDAEARWNGRNGYFYIRAVLRERCQAGDVVTITGKPELLETLPQPIQKKLGRYKRFLVLAVDYTVPGWETAQLQPEGTRERIACPARACIVNERRKGEKKR